MTKLNAYRLSTAIFALLFAAVMVRDLTGSKHDTSPHRPPATEFSQTPISPGSAEEGGPEAGVGDELEPLADARPGGPEIAAIELAMAALIRGRMNANWSTVLPRLRARREEVIPIIEDWLRRREELVNEDVCLQNIPRAYAELAGAQALPLLEELLADPGRRWSNATNEALTRINDSAAVALIHRYQESLPENHCDMRIDWLWRGTTVARGLLKEWARNPPANAPRLGPSCRVYWFSKGAMEDREDVWKHMNDLEKLNALSGGHARSWGGPWPDRFLAITTEGLRDRDPRRRCRAIFNVIADAGSVSADLLAEAEDALEHEIQAAKGRAMSEGPTQRSLLSFRRSLDAWRERTESERRRRELLTPR